jgi:hypothetical protein
VQVYPHIHCFRDMLGMRQDAIREREARLIPPHPEPEEHWDYAPWVMLANDQKVAPREPVLSGVDRRRPTSGIGSG